MMNKIKIILESQNSGFIEAFSALIEDEPDFTLKHIVSRGEYEKTFLYEPNSILVSDDIISQEDLYLRFKVTKSHVSNHPSFLLLEKSLYSGIANHSRFGGFEIFLKPVKIETLFSRIRIKSFELCDIEETLISVHGCIFKPKAKSFIKSTGKIKKLTDKETKILKLLYESHGVVVSKESLLKQIWGYSKDIATHTLETHIYRLRQKIETNPQKPELILTDFNGYYLSEEK